MGGFFGAALKEDSVFDVYFGTDYHSHLGTRRAGMVMYDEEYGFDRAIHNIENSPFRTKFEKDMKKMKGNLGIGCISDYEPQPLIVRSHHGTYAITTVGKVNNAEELSDKLLSGRNTHFLELSGGEINQTELVSTLINEEDNFIEGLQHAQDVIDGSITIMCLTPKGIYVARDKKGRTPVAIGKKDTGYCACFESFAYLNIGYERMKCLGPGEIAVITPDGVKTLVSPGKEMKICTFLWVYFGYPASIYEGVNVERMRHNCGHAMAKRDHLTKDDIDIVAGVPDSGVGHAIGYSNESGVHYSRPFVKYTPTWPRSFMPTIQTKRDMIAKMKLLPVTDLIEGRKILLIDDSIVRGTQLREATDFLYSAGAKEVHVRPACPPLLYGCKFLNFSRSTSDMELIARRVIAKLEGTEDVSEETLAKYADPDSQEYQNMVDEICRQQGFTSLRYNRLDDMLDAVGIDHDKMCTYCWDGKE